MQRRLFGMIAQKLPKPNMKPDSEAECGQQKNPPQKSLVRSGSFCLK